MSQKRPYTLKRRRYEPPQVTLTPLKKPDIWSRHGFVEQDGKGNRLPVNPPPKAPKKNPLKLPNRIIPFPCSDKSWHEKWAVASGQPPRDLLNFPHPARGVFCGPPNKGKSTALKNVVARVWPPFQRCVIIYPDGHAGTSEYDDILGDNVEILDHIPDTSYWPAVKNGAVKTLCIVDDYELKSLNKVQRASLDRLVGHVSTHRHVSVFLLSQNFYNIPPIVRRCASLFVLWKPRDLSSMDSVSTRLGVDLREMFKLVKQDHDSLWFDLSPKSPAPLRLNGYTPIKDLQGTGSPLEEDEEEEEEEEEEEPEQEEKAHKSGKKHVW